MRPSLVAMLDFIGIPRLVGISSTTQLFGDKRDLVHYTSALRYPVYVNGANYSGSPYMSRNSLLLSVIDSYLAEEARQLPNAIWVPLGPKPSIALDRLSTAGLIQPDNILNGLPHPSGANSERIAYFLGRKPRERLSVKTNPDAIDAAKSALLGKVSRLIKSMS